MQLHEMKSPAGSRKKRKIVGRGRASGHGKTSGKGTKGQKSRSGRGMHNSLEGGQMPIIRRLPKVGFNSKRPVLHQVVNVESLNVFDQGTIVTGELLKARGLISTLNRSFKVLGNGELKKSLTIKTSFVSKSAQEKIVKAGGKVELVEKQSEGSIEAAKS